MKRFTETTKWNDPWFMDLPMESKLFWLWMLDNCDHAGVIDPNVRLAAFQIGYTKGKANLLDSLGDRIAMLPNDKVWIVKFMEFQYPRLSEKCPAHTPVFKSIKKNGLDTLELPYPKASDSLKDKDKDKDTEEDTEEDTKAGCVSTWNPDEIQTRLNALYNRRPSNAWDAKMLKAYRAIDFDEEEIGLVEKAHRNPAFWKRKSLATLLNNWDEEVDKARNPQEPASTPSSLANNNADTGSCL